MAEFKCGWCGKKGDSSNWDGHYKSYKGKGVLGSVGTFMFGKTFCCERCRHAWEKAKGK